MSFKDWLHNRAEENAHNEILAFLTMILGINLLVGGLIVTLIVIGEPSLLLVLPTQQPLSPSVLLGLILTVAGFVLLSTGFILVVHYDRKRSWYISQIEKSNIYKKRKPFPKTVNEILEEYAGKRKRH